MRVFRLSRVYEPSGKKDIAQIPKLVSQAKSVPRAEDPSRIVLLATRCLLPPMLVIVLGLTLLPLLLPTIDHHGTSFFTIEPTGQERQTGSFDSFLASATATASASTSAAASTVEAEGNIVQSGNVTVEEWLGSYGPSIYVGALQICSKASANETVTCTSSSQAAYHAALLPLSLGLLLLTFPTYPYCPILLLVSGILSLLASLIFVLGLISWRLPFSLNILRRKPALEAAPHRPDHPDDTESLRHLVREDEESQKGRKSLVKVQWGSGPHPVFFCLVLAALGVGCASMIELKNVSDAWAQWDDVQATEVGLEFNLGVLTFLLPFLPVSLGLVLLVGAAPIFCRYFMVRFPNLAGPAQPEPVQTTSAASRELPDIVITHPPSGQAAQTSLPATLMVSPGPGGRRSSWRNTFGIGVAS